MTARTRNAQAGAANAAGLKASRLSVLVLIVLVGTWASTISHYMKGFYYGYSYPMNSFLFIPGDHFMDFFNDYGRAKSFLAGTSSLIDYTPFAHLVMTTLTIFSSTLAFWIMATGFVCTVVFMVWRFYVNTPSASLYERLLQLFVLVTMSYPVLFAVDRGNQEMLVFVFLFWFVYFYYVKQRPWLAVLFLVAAAAMKIYPGVFIVLLIADKRYWESVAAALSVAVVWLLSAAALGLASGRGMLYVLASTQNTLGSGGHGTYMLSLEAVGHRQSLWNILTLWAYATGRAAMLPALVRPYTLAGLVVLLVVAAYVVFVEREQWKRLSFLMFAMLLLPYLSGVYNLVHLFLPIMLFLNSRRASRFDVAYAALFALLLVPLDYVVIVSDITGITLLYPILMIAITVLMVIDRPKLGDAV